MFVLLLKILLLSEDDHDDPLTVMLRLSIESRGVGGRSVFPLAMLILEIELLFLNWDDIGLGLLAFDWGASALKYLLSKLMVRRYEN
jgi:hypothetical protein